MRRRDFKALGLTVPETSMAAYGIPTTDIARVIGVDPKTLRKCYCDSIKSSSGVRMRQSRHYFMTAMHDLTCPCQVHQHQVTQRHTLPLSGWSGGGLLMRMSKAMVSGSRI